VTTTAGSIDWHSVDVIICDFDGVLTNNFVYVNQDGSESVRCSRADGLAFDCLRKLEIPAMIFSTEKNPIVLARAAKLQLPVIHGIEGKRSELLRLADEEGWDLGKVVYVGNDLNDLQALVLCGHRVCPADAHRRVAEACTVRLTTRGGEGVVRELTEDVLGIDIVSVLYPKESS
jgi:YrbI family 3-deoxy-D-manno-octulosonate 8-phosphate phosphatase